jgi:hypothetical protein
VVSERAGILLRLDPAVRDALARWAADDLRSTNAQIDFLLRRALADAGRLPGQAGRMRPRGRPPAGRPAEASRPARNDDRTGRPRGSGSGGPPGEARP